jgi:uncharacterized protein YjbI with pentapeptide repeats
MLGSGRRVACVVGVVGLLGGVTVATGIRTTLAATPGAIASVGECVPAPRADLTGCNFAGESLIGVNLYGARLTDAILNSTNLTGADLMNATLTGAEMASTDLSNADLSSVTSGGITGSPSSLPANLSLVAGYVIGPDA